MGRGRQVAQIVIGEGVPIEARMRWPRKFAPYGERADDPEMDRPIAPQVHVARGQARLSPRMSARLAKRTPSRTANAPMTTIGR